MFSDSHLMEKAAEREWLARATEAFLNGDPAVEVPQGVAANLDGRRGAMFVINAEKRESLPVKRVSAAAAETIKIASAARSKIFSARRAALAATIRNHAARGDTHRITAAACGCSVSHVRNIAAEFDIDFSVNRITTTA